MDEIFDEYKIMILPDHPTPMSTRTHASDPVPYLIYHKSKDINNNISDFCEKSAEKTEIFIDSGVELMSRFLKETNYEKSR